MSRKQIQRSVKPEELEGSQAAKTLNRQSEELSAFHKKIRALTDPAINALKDTLSKGGHKEKVSAAKIVIEQGYGKPKESIVIDANVRVDPDALIRAFHKDKASRST